MVSELQFPQGKELDIIFEYLIQEIVCFLKEDLGWLTVLTSKQCFYWGIFATFCSQMVVNEEDLDWVHLCGFHIQSLKLGAVYCSYCESKRLSHEDRVIIDELPHDVKTHRCEDLQR